MFMTDLNWDVIVMGGGPAGAAAAAIVSESGFRTLLVEREKMPRFHVGESLMPETYWTLRRLGLLEQMRSSAFTKKYSVQFVDRSGRESQPFYFSDSYDHESSQTWQVVRGDFDKMLFDNAERLGAVCRDQTRVVDVDTSDPAAPSVTIMDSSGIASRQRCRVVIDATGQQSLLGARSGERVVNPVLKKSAVWGYCRAALREPGLDEGATLVIMAKDGKSWFWYIPLPDDVVSVGLVGDVSAILKSGLSPKDKFFEEIKNCPAVSLRTGQGRFEGPIRTMKEFSYVCKEPAGDGWVLVGDSLGFLDPIYSSGVFLALKSGEMAADCVIDALASGEPSRRRLGAWVDPFLAGMNRMRKLVYAFYTEGFSFGEFVRSYPQHRKGLTDLLVGRVFAADSGIVFDDLEPWLAARSSDCVLRKESSMTVS